MKLYYHKDLSGNFGDDLNKMMWSHFLPDYFTGEIFHDPALRKGVIEEDLFVGIGTILNNHIPTENKKAIFGSGTGYGEAPQVDKSWVTYFVRGPLTAKKLGLPPLKAITDPGILVQFLDIPEVKLDNPISFIPHCSTARSCDWEDICKQLNVNYIDPQNTPEYVLARIKASDYVITEAMHGAIIADAYRVPWLAVKTNPSILDMKWEDWCLSLELMYKPASLPTLWKAQGNNNILKQLGKKLKHIKAKKLLSLLTADKKTFILSSDNIYNDRTQKILDKIDEFKSDYNSGAFK